MALAGREEELGALAAAADAVAAGERRALAITGEPGIGKSALLDAARAAAHRRGLLVLAGRAAEHERDVPFSVLVDALDAHVARLPAQRLEPAGPALAHVLPSALRDGAAPPAPVEPSERYQLHRALATLLELVGRRQPVALLLDDVHWADAATVEVLGHLLRRPPAVPHLLVVAVRPGDEAERLRGAGVEELRVRPLAAADAHALLPDDLPRAVAERVVADADGNPLFLLELARVAAAGGGEALPPSLAAALERDVATLEPAARALLDAAAVAGDRFDTVLLAAAAGVPAPADPAPLLAAGLLRPDEHGGGGLAFRHPLLRRAVYDAVPPDRREAAHARAAAALAEQGADPVVRAYHVEQSARRGDEDAIAVLVEAARRTAATSPAASASRYAAALALLPDGDDARRVELLTARGRALALVGPLEEAVGALDDAYAHASPATRGRLVAEANALDYLLEAWPRAEARVARALQDDPPPALRPWLLWHRAGTLLARDRAPEALPLLDEVRAGLAEAEDADLLAIGLVALDGSALTFSGGNADAATDRALAALAAVDDERLAEHLGIVWFLCGMLVHTERAREGLEVLTRALRLARTAQSESYAVAFHLLAATAALPLGRLREGLEHAEAAEEGALLRGLTWLAAVAATRRAQLHAAHGDVVQAEAAVAASEVLMPDDDGGILGRSSAAHNAIVRHAHDPARLRAEVVGHVGEDAELVTSGSAPRPLVALIRAALATGDVEAADRWATRLERLSAERGFPITALRARRVRADVLLAQGDAREALKRARDVAIEAEEQGLLEEALAAGVVTGRALLALGRAEAGADELRRVADVAARAGILADRDAALRELRRTGTRAAAPARPAAPAAAVALPDGLTPREREIVELVALGRTNREVAAALHLSDKTVENHLSRVYAKLGVRSRVELRATLH